MLVAVKTSDSASAKEYFKVYFKYLNMYYVFEIHYNMFTLHFVSSAFCCISVIFNKSYRAEYSGSFRIIIYNEVMQK